MIICIDPGHGGSDPGAVGADGLMEKDAALSICLLLKSIAEAAGHKIIMTRETNIDVAYPNATASEELWARCNISNNAKADLFISVHCNSFGFPSANGTETFYASPKGARLAKKIHSELVNLGLTDRNIKTAGFYVLLHTDAPAVLVELAFISNPEEEAMLKKPAMQRAFAEAIHRGIQNYKKGA